MPESIGGVPAASTRLDRVATLQHLDSLRQLPIAELEHLAPRAVLRMYEPQTQIIAEHDIARHIYVLIGGNAEQCLHGPDGETTTLAMLGRGDIFGEGGLFGLRYRRTTVLATTRCTALQISYSDIQPYLDRLPTLRTSLRVRFRERLLQTTLATVPLLAPLTPLERLAIAAQLDDQRVERGDQILRAGDMSDGLYVLAEGQAQVIRDGQPLAVIGPGDVFGEMSLLDNQPHEASIVALTPVHLLLMPRPAYEYVLDKHPEIAERLRWLANQRRSTDRSTEHIAITERLISTGIVRGNAVLARREELCAPNCHRCEQGCAERYGHARLHFSGVEFGALQTVDSCRHCRWGAECAEVCPEDAFRLDAEGILIITDRCTGCGECVAACPYDAIDMIPVYEPVTNPFQWLMRQTGHAQPKHIRADKCDTCTGHDDYACISACPTGALQWIPVEALYEQAQHHHDTKSEST